MFPPYIFSDRTAERLRNATLLSYFKYFKNEGGTAIDFFFVFNSLLSNATGLVGFFFYKDNTIIQERKEMGKMRRCQKEGSRLVT